MEGRIYPIIDDSGFLAIVDPDAYETFVSEDWNFSQLEKHFRKQMAERRLLIWRTGMEAIWDVLVSTASGDYDSFREVAGPLISTRGRFFLTSLNSLSMAAQFADVVLPEPHDIDQILTLPVGEYCCRIVQRYNPSSYSEQTDDFDGPEYVIELTTDKISNLVPWDRIPWLENSWL